MSNQGRYQRRNFAAKMKSTCNVCLEPVVLIRGNDGNMTAYDVDESTQHRCKRKRTNIKKEFEQASSGQLHLPNVI